MLLTNAKLLAILCAIILGFVIFSAMYAYHTNAKRAPDDPEKKDFAPQAVFLAVITLPLLLVVDLLFLLLYTIAFGIILLFLPLVLLLFRKPLLIPWILKQALKVGNKLLEVNTAMLRASGFYRPAAI